MAPPLKPVDPIKQLLLTSKIAPLKETEPPISGFNSAGSGSPVSPLKNNNISDCSKIPEQFIKVELFILSENPAKLMQLLEYLE